MAKHIRAIKKDVTMLRKRYFKLYLPYLTLMSFSSSTIILKKLQGKGHRCAQKHCIRKLLRLIDLFYYILAISSFAIKIVTYDLHKFLNVSIQNFFHAFITQRHSHFKRLIIYYHLVRPRFLFSNCSIQMFTIYIVSFS